MATNSVRQMGVTTNSAPAAMAARAVFASSTVPTPIKARSPSFSRTSRMATRTWGVVMVISMTLTPPAIRASDSGSTCAACCARTTAMIPGSVRSEMMSALGRILPHVHRGSVRPAVSFGEESDRVDNTQVQALVFGAVDKLEQAAGVAVGHDAGAGRFDVLELAVQKLVGHLRLHNVVNAGAAAAPQAFRQLDQLQVRDQAQQLTRLVGGLLPVRPGAGLVGGG